ncbi:glycosyltransferase family A protein [Alteromonas sp. 1_MG-2023]|uniref:glycosyltransferase family A protein n=1 Tax=unclassified Alteromonas TaxID=2614992 RepID=UPI0026E37018|nr:glycosyltransferase family A protein [Alteromonas sp. 1_MG-2023]MDO6476485.1 glycosyltransferase family A protein [Alteromonas sp. 1_MG-2023]
MKDEPLISVIIPCYQQSHLLQRALNSVESQTYRNIEVIVIDDGSEPAVNVQPEKFSFPVILIRQSNSGLPAARNSGLQAASGTLIKFLDSDDELLPCCLEEQVSAMNGDTSAISCIGYREQFEDTGESLNVVRAFGNPLHGALMLNLYPVHCYLFKKTDVIAAGGFDVSERTRGGHEDYDLLLRLLLNNAQVITHHCTGVVYYRYSGSMSTNHDAMHRSRANVWTNAVKQLLIKNNLSGHTLMAILTSFSHLNRITPAAFSSDLKTVRSMLEEKLRVQDFPGGAQIQTLIDELQDDPANLSLIELLRPGLCQPPPYGAYWELQELIDYRTSVALPIANFRDDYLVSLFALIREKQNIAVYGAGELGQRITGLIKSAGFEVKVIFDQNWEQIKVYRDVPVVKVDAENVSGIDVIIIASLAYKEEISASLSASFPSVQLF